MVRLALTTGSWLTMLYWQLRNSHWFTFVKPKWKSLMLTTSEKVNIVSQGVRTQSIKIGGSRGTPPLFPSVFITTCTCLTLKLLQPQDCMSPPNLKYLIFTCLETFPNFFRLKCI